MNRRSVRHRLGPVVRLEDRLAPAVLTFTLDSAQSRLAISGTSNGSPFVQQATNSLTAPYSGTMVADVDLATNTIRFVMAGSSMAAGNTGSWQPSVGGTSETGTAPGNYGGLIDRTVIVEVAIRNAVGAFSTSTAMALSGTGSSRSFPSAQRLTLRSAFLDYYATSTIKGREDFANAFATNTALLLGTFADLGNGSARLTTPVSVNFSDTITVGTAQEPLFYSLNGTLVGTAPFPTVDLNGSSAGADTTAAYGAGSPAVAVAPALQVLRNPGGNITSATVAMTNRLNGASESLAVNLAGTGLTSSGYNSTTGTLTITGSASLATYQTALRTLTYANTAGSGTSAGNRVVSVMVNDGTINSLPHTATVAVTAVPPVLANMEGSALVYTENAAATPITATMTVSDSDSPILGSGSVSISTNYQSGQDVLSYSAPAGNPVTGSFNPATGVLALSGAATPAQYQAALRAVKYHNTSDNPVAAPRTLNFSASDGPFNSNIASRTITVTPVNDPPLLLNIEASALVYSVNGPSTPVTSTLTVNDVDSATFAFGFVGISTNYESGQDVLSYAPPAGNPVTGSFNPANGILNLTGPGTRAEFEAALRAVTYQNTSNNPVTAARTLFIQVNDGTALSNASTREITIVNNPPVVTDIRVNDGSAQRSRVTRLTVTFNEVVTLDPGALTLAGFAGTLTPAVDNSGGHSILTLTFDGLGTDFGSLSDGNYTLTVNAASVRDLTGNQLSGNASLSFHRLFGDVNGDKSVNGLDLAGFRTAFGSAAADANYRSDLDFNGDGAINGLDLAAFRTRFGVTLP